MELDPKRVDFAQDALVQAVLAISSGSAKRSNGLIWVNWSICSFVFPTKNNSVAVAPGAIAFTVIDRPRNSFAKLV